MKNKKILLIIISIAIIGVISIILASVIISNNKSKYGVHKISFNTLEEKIQNKESFILVIENDSCSYCELYHPKIENISKEYKVLFNYVILSELSKEEQIKLNEYVNNYTGTPTTAFFKNGEEMESWTRINGNKSSDYIISRLEKLEYIKK